MKSDELTSPTAAHEEPMQSAAAEGLAVNLAWWRRELEGASFLMDLPADRRRPFAQSGRAARRAFALDASLCRQLTRLGGDEGASRFDMMLAAFAALLYRYTDLADVLIGTPDDHHETVGGCVHAAVVRVKLAGDVSFRDLIRQVRTRSSAVHEHRRVPFERLIEALGVTPHPSHHPLYQAALRMLKNEVSDRSGGMTPFGAGNIECRSPMPDLSLCIEESRSRTGAFWEYNCDLFEPATIDRATAHFTTLLTSLLHSPDDAISAARFLGATELSALEAWGVGARRISDPQFVHRMFERQAEQTPRSLAVSHGGASVSYGELNAWADRIAERLRLAGVTTDDLVGICAQRSIAWVAGLLGILKAGAGYLSLDPSYPPERLQFMIGDARTRVVCIGKGLTRPFEACGAALLDLDRYREGQPVATAARRVFPDSCAYAVYTSGSTGRPKAVVSCHGALSNLVRWHTETYRITRADRASQFARMGFDASVWEIWPYLANGASVHILAEEQRLSPRDVARFVIDNRITIGFFPPVIAESMLVQPWPDDLALRAVLTGGDRLLAHPPRGLPFRYFNHYGPSEATVAVTAGEVEPAGEHCAPPPIGRPLDNARILLLDEALERVPALRTGDLYIGGDVLGRGYLHQPALTAERFVPDPFSDRPGARMYRTGDLARFEPNGDIAFVGRSDGQVKIHGFRIEPGEIESVLMQQPGIEGAAVVVRESAGQHQLAAFLVASGERASDDELRAALHRSLPQFMVPASYTWLDQFPLSPNGKVMRDALPRVTPAPPAGEDPSAQPTSELERKLANIWQEVLQIPAVGVHHNFFDLGGQSITAARVREVIRERLDIDVSVVELLRNGTIRELAQHLRRGDANEIIQAD